MNRDTLPKKKAHASSPAADGSLPQRPMDRRNFIVGVGGAALLSAVAGRGAWAADTNEVTVNLAKVAIPSGLYVSGDSKLAALNDGNAPRNSRDTRHGVFGTWPHTENQ